MAKTEQTGILILTTLGMLGGCATYAPQPLEDTSAILRAPPPTVLSTSASNIVRPWLKATPVDLAQPLTPEGIAALAVVNNPDLVALRTQAGIADAQVFAAGLLPDPVISMGVEKVLSGPDTLLNIAGAIGLDLGALRRRAVSRAEAQAEARQVRLDIAWSEWQTAGAARLAAVRIVGLTRILALATASDMAAQRWLKQTEAAARSGDVPATDLETARLVLRDAVSQRQTAEHSLTAARGDLARLLGLPPGRMLAQAPMLLPPRPPAATKLFAEARANRTDLAALREGYAAQEAAVRLAVLDQFPTLNLSLTPGRDSTGNTLLGPTLDFTLPIWNRNRGGIAIAKATRESLKAEYEARLFQTRAEITAAEDALALARRQYTNARAAKQALATRIAATNTAARRGDLPQTTAESARQLLRDRALLEAQAELAIHEQTIALELLSGTTAGSWQQ